MPTMIGLMNVMESAGFGGPYESLEERRFFKRPPPGYKPQVQIQTKNVVPMMQVMESAGFGDSLEERIFFTGKPTKKEPAQVARLVARKAAAGLLRSFIAHRPEDEARCERLAAWSRRLAKELKLTAERVLDVELGALLHDVGHMGLRRVDFNSRGPLTPDQWSELRRHTDIGVELLKGIPALRRAIPLVAAHHERFDGTGYPLGLSGQQIPVEARIFHLVDAYDAMTSERAYSRMSDTDARAELERGVGTLFDPLIFAAFDCVDPSDWRDIVRSL